MLHKVESLNISKILYKKLYKNRFIKTTNKKKHLGHELFFLWYKICIYKQKYSWLKSLTLVKVCSSSIAHWNKKKTIIKN